MLLKLIYQFKSNQFLLRFEKSTSAFSKPVTPTAAQEVEIQKVINLLNSNWSLVVNGETLTGEMKSSTQDHDGLVQFTAKRK